MKKFMSALYKGRWIFFIIVLYLNKKHFIFFNLLLQFSNLTNAELADKF